MVASIFFAVPWDLLPAAVAEAELPSDLEEQFEDYEAGLSYEGKGVQGEFVWAYQALAPHWDARSREAFESFFRPLFRGFWDDGGPARLDGVSPEDAERLGIDFAWSPEAVRRHAELWDRIDLATAEEPFEDHAHSAPHQFDGFEAWASLGEEAGQMVRDAAASGHGLIEVVFA